MTTLRSLLERLDLMSSTIKPMNLNSVSGTISIPSTSINTGVIGAVGAVGPIGAVGATGAITSITIGGGGGGSMISNSGNYTASTSWSTNVSKPVYYTTTDSSSADIVIHRKSGDIRVGDTLKHILDTFCIIVPDQALLDDNPALKAAYDHHQAVIQETLGTKLKESFDSYKTIERLIQQDNHD